MPGHITPGRLRLFFGMAAGVGKTCAMLRAAHALAATTDVVVGIIETHGRAETLALLDGLEQIHLAQFRYRDADYDEMNLDAILARRPQLVLVDELAHTNVPGARHEKRYQDVIELLNAGIDVYSTMNVQHLESRADIVGLLTGTTVRETVPDSLLDQVDEIELIDLTPDALRVRLREGKIYPTRQANLALEHFFQEGNLHALREIALRVTADKVERDRAKDPDTAHPSGLRERPRKLLVAISASIYAERSIRMARRLVDDLEIPWIAVHVDTGALLPAAAHNQLIKNLHLAEEMGAETLTLHGSDLVQSLSRCAEEHDVVHVVVGHAQRPAQRWRRRPRWIAQLIDRNPHLDITVLQHPTDQPAANTATARRRHMAWPSIGVALSGVAGVTVLNHLLAPWMGYQAVGYVYLLLVVIAGMTLPISGVIATTISSALCWDMFFVPPMGSLRISEPADIMMLCSYALVAATSGLLTHKIKTNEQMLRTRESTSRALYDVLTSMTLVRGTQPFIQKALRHIETLLGATCAIILATDDTLDDRPAFGTLSVTDSDRAVAAWTFANGRMAGWSTDTLPLARVLCLALKSGEATFGVICFRPKQRAQLTPDQEDLLISITNQIAIALAKQAYDAEQQRTELLHASDQLHQTLLNCISHELRTPLTAVLGAATALHTELAHAPATTQALTDEVIAGAQRLNHIIENLLDVTRLESGAIALKQEWFDMAELIHWALAAQHIHLQHHRILFAPPAQSIYYYGDFALLGHAVINILFNASRYAPAKSAITLHLRLDSGTITLTIRDEGPGLPTQDTNKVFEKFFRAAGSNTGGLGLGLSITKSLIELHGGTITAGNHPDGGAVFTIQLPYEQPPAALLEASR